ncbi:hypothetical protein L1987_28337 [Smallanthus sonchifolius]|uniref:Uncharacterized protein n=1 Tax=Smallanthus sonchifolius TaxID=185202 RepID=A0ACB9HY53_9ASTR|nr:hypothetical protein L1987_28337 [Smallanthus sonchifolius]
MGPLNLQRKKQNPIKVKFSSQQYAPVRSNGSQNPAVISGVLKNNTPVTTRDVNKSGVNKPPTAGLNASKKVSTGFNFARAVQGPSDLYPPDQGLDEGMELEINKSNCSDKVVCQLNREHVDGSRILPESIMSPPKQGGNSSRGKSYGISDEQKKDIAGHLKNSGGIKVDIVDQWCPGQWDYFSDLCTLIGLDPDYCIEDVDSDTENGTSQFLSGLFNSGAPKPPRKLNRMVAFYLTPDFAVRLHFYVGLEAGWTIAMFLVWNIWSCPLLLLPFGLVAESLPFVGRSEVSSAKSVILRGFRRLTARWPLKVLTDDCIDFTSFSGEHFSLANKRPSG